MRHFFFFKIQFNFLKNQKAKYDPNDEYSIENLSELDLSFLKLNVEEKSSFQIINPNPEKVEFKITSSSFSSNL